MATIEGLDRALRVLGDAHDVFRKDVITQAAHPTARSILRTMQSLAPRLTGAMASALSVDGGLVGILDDSEQASVALYNEYSPNQQPFMRPAAQAHENELVSRATAVCQAVERKLSE